MILHLESRAKALDLESKDPAWSYGFVKCLVEKQSWAVERGSVLEPEAPPGFKSHLCYSLCVQSWVNDLTFWPQFKEGFGIEALFHL